MKIIDDFIAEIRRFGIKKVANLSGVSREVITLWCSKKINPTLANAEKVADAMGFEFLLFEKE